MTNVAVRYARSIAKGRGLPTASNGPDISDSGFNALRNQNKKIQLKIVFSR